MKCVGLIAFALLLAACAGSNAARVAPAVEHVDLGDDLELRELADGLWLHVSSKEMPGYGKVPSNGLVVLGPDGALLVDTPWTPSQTQALVAWIEQVQRSRLVDVVVTHAHEDRTGGVAALADEVRIHALAETAALSAGLGRPFTPVELPPTASLDLAGGKIETFFPGAGHAPDNIVVWLPERQLLFGGCFVKAGAAGNLGNVADADLASWGGAVERVRERYPDADVVVPGHGPLGGPELLVHTGALIEAAGGEQAR
ncbi:subclass B1 metallo-beta-lactamase [Vulgatibacter sp.]|uniref:subclass B1 metallo-beta-lactamase n=1 Tax=Vulgatibacter sp. TaxID=1971226 RepID=UPI00356A022C